LVPNIEPKPTTHFGEKKYSRLQEISIRCGRIVCSTVAQNEKKRKLDLKAAIDMGEASIPLSLCAIP
jgi:hypothetical protein